MPRGCFPRKGPREDVHVTGKPQLGASLPSASGCPGKRRHSARRYQTQWLGKTRARSVIDSPPGPPIKNVWNYSCKVPLTHGSFVRTLKYQRLSAAYPLLAVCSHLLSRTQPGAGSIFDSSHVTLSSRAATTAGGTPGPAAPPVGTNPWGWGRGKGWGPPRPGSPQPCPAGWQQPARCRRAGGNEHISPHGAGRRSRARSTIYCIHQVLLAGRNEA